MCDLPTQANEEVQRFLNGSFSTNQYDELSRILEVKCRTLNNLLTALQDATRGKCWDLHVLVSLKSNWTS